MIDSTAPGFTPWWTRCTPSQFGANMARLKRALPYCRGRAADHRAHLAAHIEFLEWWFREKM